MELQASSKSVMVKPVLSGLDTFENGIVMSQSASGERWY